MSYMREDKQEIMNLLLKTLQATREYSDLALDSGSAMIRDVLKALR